MPAKRTKVTRNRPKGINTVRIFALVFNCSQIAKNKAIKKKITPKRKKTSPKFLNNIPEKIKVVARITNAATLLRCVELITYHLSQSGTKIKALPWFRFII